MKKFIFIMLFSLMLIFLSACGNPSGIAASTTESFDTELHSEVSEIEESDTELTDTSQNSKIKTESSEEDKIPVNASENAVEMYNRYINLSKDNGFRVSDITVNGDWTSFSLKIGKSENKLNFYKGNKSFSVYIDNDTSSNDKKKAIAKILIGLTDISADDAQELSQNIANSYSNDSFSDTQDVGDYLVVLLPDESQYINSFKQLKCIYKEELWDTVNKEDYSPIDKQMYEAPDLNIGEKCKVVGTITDWHFETFYSNTHKGVATIQCDNGDEYCIQYLYDYKPVSLEVGKVYTIYGTIANKYISVDYPEKSN